RIDADHLEALEVYVLQVRRARLHHHLVLGVMLPAVGILSVAAVGRAAAGLAESGVPPRGPERAQRGGGVERAGPHPHVVRLEDQAALRAPVIMEREDHVLEASGRVPVHRAGPWRMGSGASIIHGKTHRWRDARFHTT